MGNMELALKQIGTIFSMNYKNNLVCFMSTRIFYSPDFLYNNTTMPNLCFVLTE